MPDQYITVGETRYKLAPAYKIPTDNPDLPSYEDEELSENKSKLEFLLDMFGGSNRWLDPIKGITNQDKAKAYLPQWSREPDSEYQKRVKRSLFHNFFGPSVKGFPGFLSDLQSTENLYPGMLEYEKDIDLQGNNLISFLWQADLKVIRDGFCGILVDMPRVPRDQNGNKLIKTLADQQKYNFKPRPYLVLIDRRNILSTCSSLVNGKIQLDRITIRECVTQSVGRFGTEEFYRYKTFYSDGSYVIEVLIDVNEDVQTLTVEEGVSSLKEVPVVLYSATDINPIEAEPPLFNLAQKNQAYYELYSEYREIIHKMNCPVPVRIGLMMPGMSNYNDLPDMVFGANTGIDLPQGGDFKFAELSGKVLETDRSELSSLAASMNEESLRFLTGNTTERTATEVQLESSQTQATLSGIATLKESAIEQIADKWAKYDGQKNAGGTVVVNRELLKMPLTEGEMNALSNMAAQQQISVITLLELLKEGKRLPNGVKPSLEVQRLAAQLRASAKKDMTLDEQIQVTTEMMPFASSVPVTAQRYWFESIAKKMAGKMTPEDTQVMEEELDETFTPSTDQTLEDAINKLASELGIDPADLANMIMSQQQGSDQQGTDQQTTNNGSNQQTTEG